MAHPVLAGIFSAELVRCTQHFERTHMLIAPLGDICALRRRHGK